MASLDPPLEGRNLPNIGPTAKTAEPIDVQAAHAPQGAAEDHQEPGFGAGTGSDALPFSPEQTLALGTALINSATKSVQQQAFNQDPMMAVAPSSIALQGPEPIQLGDMIAKTEAIQPSLPATLSPPRTAIGDHPQAKQPALPPTALDPMASPLRQAPGSTAGLSLASPVPPPSAGKREVNEAAMALTWLAEALTGPGHQSPMAAPRPTAAAAALLSADRPTVAGGSSGLRGRRAASQRCATVIQEAILNERMLTYAPQRQVASASDDNRPRGRPKAAALAAAVPATVPTERKIKGYSQNSRVGRAMASILQYISDHQPQYLPGGVPERVIRQEFGNNPDTSKALRFLVGETKIVRAGLGGRRDPFNYTLAAEGQTPEGQEGATAFPANSAEENGGVPGQIPLLTASRTPIVEGTLAESGAAAAAALAAPSTGKWESTMSRVESDHNRRKPLQPRLSLGVADPAAVQEGRKEAARMAEGRSGKTVGVKRSYAPSSSLLSPLHALAPNKRLASDQLLPSSFVSPRPVAPVAGELLSRGVAGMAAAVIAAAAAPEMATPTVDHKTEGWVSWPSQLPSTQRLTMLASPPPLSAPRPASTPGSMFLGASAALLGGGAPGATPSAYLLQLQAAQMLWQHQLAQRGHATHPMPAVQRQTQDS